MRVRTGPKLPEDRVPSPEWEAGEGLLEQGGQPGFGLSKAEIKGVCWPEEAALAPWPFGEQRAGGGGKNPQTLILKAWSLESQLPHWRDVRNAHSLPRWLCNQEPACQCRRHERHGFDPWVGKIPWRRAWQPTPVFLPGESPGQRNLAGCSPWGRRESDPTEAT